MKHSPIMYFSTMGMFTLGGLTLHKITPNVNKTLCFKNVNKLKSG